MTDDRVARIEALQKADLDEDRLAQRCKAENRPEWVIDVAGQQKFDDLSLALGMLLITVSPSRSNKDCVGGRVALVN